MKRKLGWKFKQNSWSCNNFTRQVRFDSDWYWFISNKLRGRCCVGRGLAFVESISVQYLFYPSAFSLLPTRVHLKKDQYILPNIILLRSSLMSFLHSDASLYIPVVWNLLNLFCLKMVENKGWPLSGLMKVRDVSCRIAGFPTRFGLPICQVQKLL